MSDHCRTPTPAERAAIDAAWRADPEATVAAIAAAASVPRPMASARRPARVRAPHRVAAAVAASPGEIRRWVAESRSIAKRLGIGRWREVDRAEA